MPYFDCSELVAGHGVEAHCLQGFLRRMELSFDDVYRKAGKMDFADFHRKVGEGEGLSCSDTELIY